MNGQPSNYGLSVFRTYEYCWHNMCCFFHVNYLQISYLLSVVGYELCTLNIPVVQESSRKAAVPWDFAGGLFGAGFRSLSVLIDLRTNVVFLGTPDKCRESS